MTKKQKEEKVKEMERFLNEGVPEEAREKDYMWETEPPIHTYAIASKQRVNEKENKKSLDVIDYEDANPVRSDDAKINAPDNRVEKETDKKSKGTVNKTKKGTEKISVR